MKYQHDLSAGLIEAEQLHHRQDIGTALGVVRELQFIEAELDHIADANKKVKEAHRELRQALEAELAKSSQLTEEKDE